MTTISSTGEKVTPEQRTNVALRAIAHGLQKHRDQLSVLAGEVDPQFMFVVEAMGEHIGLLAKLTEALTSILTHALPEGIQAPIDPEKRVTREARASDSDLEGMDR